MRSRLPPAPHVPHEPSSVFKGRQPNARHTLRLDHARQFVSLRLKSCFWGFGTAPSYGIEI